MGTAERALVALEECDGCARHVVCVRVYALWLDDGRVCVWLCGACLGGFVDALSERLAAGGAR